MGGTIIGGRYRIASVSAIISAILLLVTIVAVNATATSVSSFSAALSSSTVSAQNVTATLSLTTSATLASGTEIAVMLTGSPSSFNLSSVSNSSITSATLSGSGQITTFNNQTYIIYTLSSQATAGSYTLSIAGIGNPSTSSTGTFMLSTTGVSGFSSNTYSSAQVTVGQSGNDDQGGPPGDDGGEQVTGDNTVTVTVQDASGTALANQTVFTYCGMSYTTGTTNSSGVATLTQLANGNCGTGLTASNGYYAEQVYFTFPTSTTAQTKTLTLTAESLDTTLTLTVLNSSGQGASSVGIYLTDTTGREFGGSTNSEGILTIGIDYGTYTIDGYVSWGSTDYIPTGTMTVSSDPATQAQTIQLQAYTAFIRGTVTAAATGGALSTPRIIIYSTSGFSFSEGNSDGTYSVGVLPGTHNVKGEVTGYANGILENVAVGANETKTGQNLALVIADNTLNITLKDTSNNTLSLDGMISCNDATMGFDPSTVYFQQLSSGTASFSLPDATYECKLFTNDYVIVGSPTFTLADGETENGTITVQQNNSTLVINVQDQDGNALSNVRFGVFGSSANGYSITGYSMGGAVSLGAIADTYTLRIYVMSGDYISDYGTANTVTLTANSSTETTITVYATAGIISGQVTTSTGAASDGALIIAKQQTTDGSKGFEFKTNTSSSGNYQLGVVAGTYSVQATKEGSSELPSNPTTVIVTTGATTTANLALQASTATLTVTPVATTGDSLTVASGNCYAYIENGPYVTAAVSSAGSASLAVIAGTWQYGCRVVVDDVVYNTATDGSVVVEDGDTATVTVAVANDGNNYDNLLYQFSATNDSTITLPNGTEVFVPANAIANSGNTIVMASLDTDVAVSDTAFPLAPVALTARDGNNRAVTGDFKGDVTIKFPYTEDQLATYGLSEDQLTAETYTDGGWGITERGYTVDTTNNVVTVTTNHFSSFGLIGVKSVSSDSDDSDDTDITINKPRQLKAKNITNHSALLTWKKPKDTIVDHYAVQVRKFHQKKQKKWIKYNNVTKTRKPVNKLKALTRYQFRIKACTTSACGLFTKWTGFKTK